MRMPRRRRLLFFFGISSTLLLFFIAFNVHSPSNSVRSLKEESLNLENDEHALPSRLPNDRSWIRVWVNSTDSSTKRSLDIDMPSSSAPSQSNNDVYDWLNGLRADTGKFSQRTTLKVNGDTFNVVKDSARSPSVIGQALPFSCSFSSFNDSLVRNCLTHDVIGHVPVNLKIQPIRKQRGPSIESGAVRQNSFEQVFKSRAWGHSWDLQNTGLNASGMGATLSWTQELIGALHVLINDMKSQLGMSRVRILDVPCGDMAWMSRFLKTRDDVDYTGIDIVPALIEHHRTTFVGHPWKFHHLDVTEEPIEEVFDVIICRTLAQHLYLNDIMRLLRKLGDSGSRFLLTTSFYRASENSELEISGVNPGRFRPINLELPPISLVPPLCVLRDGPPDVREGWDHYVGLWRLPLRQVRKCHGVNEFTLRGTDKRIFSCTDWSIR